MKKLALLLMLLLPTSAHAVLGPVLWIAKVNDFAATNKTGDNAGMTAADLYMSPYGFGQMWPGTEAVTMPTYRPGILWLMARYDSWRVWGVPLESWPRGVRQFRADSSGVTITNKAVIGDSLRVGAGGNFSGTTGTMTIGPTGDRIDFSSAGASVINASNATGVVRLTQNGTNRVEANTNGVNLIGRVAVTGKETISDSLTVVRYVNVGNYTVSALPSAPNGSIAYATDGSPTNPVTAGGTGKFVRRENGAWNGGPSDPSLASDTLGTIIQAGRPASQVVIGSSQTTASGTTFFGVRGFNNNATGATGAAWSRWDTDIGNYADNIFFGEKDGVAGHTWSLAASGVVNETMKGSFRVNATTTGVPGKSGMVYLDKSGGGATVPNLGIEPADNQNETSGRAIAGRDSSGSNETWYVSPHGRAGFAEVYLQNATVASAASITLPVGEQIDVTGTTTVTAIAVRSAGAHVRLRLTGACTIQAGPTLAINGDFVGDGTGTGDVLWLTSNGTAWEEDSRSFQ